MQKLNLKEIITHDRTGANAIMSRMICSILMQTPGLKDQALVDNPIIDVEFKINGVEVDCRKMAEALYTMLDSWTEVQAKNLVDQIGGDLRELSNQIDQYKDIVKERIEKHYQGLSNATG